MKTLIISLFSLLLINQSFAQKEGTIHYKETIKLDINLDELKDLPAEMKALIPTEQSTENVLTFHTTASLYTNSSKDENEDVDYKSEGEDVQIKIQMGSPDRAYFYDIAKKSSIEGQEFFGKKFLVENAKPRKWKIGSEKKEILGYTCKKATAKGTDGELVEAWFTSAIPVAVGPSSFHGLPGAILSASTDNGKYEVVATKVVLEAIDQTLVVPSRKGKKVNAEQFEKIVEAKQKEMIEEYGGDGNMIIKTEMIER
jgi:GLPGLI family protein